MQVCRVVGKIIGFKMIYYIPNFARLDIKFII